MNVVKPWVVYHHMHQRSATVIGSRNKIVSAGELLQKY
jgi:hypothetical protein